MDTILFSTLCTGELQHTLFLWDTAPYRTPDCRQEFPIYQVRFFVTGYWCPTTERFRGYSPCASLFTDKGCVQPPCDDQRLYDYVVEQRPKYPDCIRYEEFQQRGERPIFELVPLPDGVVGVLNWHRTKRSGIAGDEARIKRGHFPIDDPHKPTIRIILGCVFASLIGLPFGSAGLQNLARALYGNPDDLVTAKNFAIMILPFMIGYSTILVLAILERTVDSIRTFFGIAAK